MLACWYSAKEPDSTALQLENVEDMFVTEPVSKSGTVVRLLQSLNVACMIVTELVSNNGTVTRFRHIVNMLCIVVTELVSNSGTVIIGHTANVASIFTTPVLFAPITSIKSLLDANKEFQSVLFLVMSQTLLVASTSVCESPMAGVYPVLNLHLIVNGGRPSGLYGSTGAAAPYTLVEPR